jgi:hypothetical protein
MIGKHSEMTVTFKSVKQAFDHITLGHSFPPFSNYKHPLCGTKTEGKMANCVTQLDFI